MKYDITLSNSNPEFPIQPKDGYIVQRLSEGVKEIHITGLTGKGCGISLSCFSSKGEDLTKDIINEDDIFPITEPYTYNLIVRLRTLNNDLQELTISLDFV